MFNRCHQGESESVDEYITDLHRLAGFYEYGPLKDDFICDRLVVRSHVGNSCQDSKAERVDQATIANLTQRYEIGPCSYTQAKEVRKRNSREKE